MSERNPTIRRLNAAPTNQWLPPATDSDHIYNSASWKAGKLL
eukprot:CAMPEP_0172876258 /NCGR_PEP_ID=MMETSP1075-20121228/103860_1 /TAXON_ID=2916 /ORGANISM="Ceratium fusus, Strain PA161109" /LENGTH=41 /DNA_ID= /DNA_START= /DNA_END= /DNA_ORIENTATION=